MPGPVSFWTPQPPKLHLVSWAGQGKPTLLVHGMGAHTHWWDQTALLLAATLRPVAIDLRGYGDSDWRPDGIYSMRAFVADIEDARLALGWDRFALVGHSFGARVALEYAAAYPERVPVLAAVDFLPEFRPGVRAFERARSRPQPYYDDPAVMASRYRLEPPGTSLDAAALRRLGELSYKRNDDRYTWKFDWRCLRCHYAPLWPVLPHIRARTLIVRGASSEIMDDDAMRRVASAIPGASTAVVAGAQHHVSLDEPRALADLLLSFL